MPSRFFKAASITLPQGTLGRKQAYPCTIAGHRCLQWQPARGEKMKHILMKGDNHPKSNAGFFVVLS